MTPQEEGQKYLGKGVYLFEKTLNPNPDRGRVVNVNLEDIEIQTPGETGIHEITANSFAEFTHKFAVDAGLKGSYQGFSGALKTKYSNSVTQSINTKYMRISNILTCDITSIGTDPDAFHSKLTQEFQNALQNKTAEEIFLEYGTHVAMQVKLGGSANYSCYSVETKSISEQDFKFSAEAGFKSTGGSINGSTELTNNEKESLNNVQGDVALDVRGGGAAEAQDLRENKAGAWAKWAASVKASPAFMGFPDIGLVPIWKFVTDPGKRTYLAFAYQELFARNPKVEIFWHTSSQLSERPDERVVIPDEYKLLSGGALVSAVTTRQKGLLLTASFPESDNTWRAMAKDHEEVDTTMIIPYAMAIYDPDDIWDVKIFSSTSQNPTNRPSQDTFITDPSYTLVGGGATVNWKGYGLLLTESFPCIGPGGKGYWRASAKDHLDPDIATITSYAIGLRSRLPGTKIDLQMKTSRSSSVQNWPSAQVSRPSGYTMVGGGARVYYNGAGNLLTASYPLDADTWEAKSKDHLSSDPATIEAYALAIKVSTLEFKPLSH